MSWLCSVFKRDSQTYFFSGVCRLHLTATKPKIGEDAARQSFVQYPEVFRIRIRFRIRRHLKTCQELY